MRVSTGFFLLSCLPPVFGSTLTQLGCKTVGGENTREDTLNSVLVLYGGKPGNNSLCIVNDIQVP